MRFVKQQNWKYLDTQSADNDEITQEQLQRLFNEHNSSLIKIPEQKSSMDATGKVVLSTNEVRTKVINFVADLQESLNQ